MELLTKAFRMLSQDMEPIVGSAILDKRTCRNVNIAIARLFPNRDEKIQFVRTLTGRKLTSTKELRTNEAIAILKLQEHIPEELGRRPHGKNAV